MLITAIKSFFSKSKSDKSEEKPALRKLSSPAELKEEASVSTVFTDIGELSKQRFVLGAPSFIQNDEESVIPIYPLLGGEKLQLIPSSAGTLTFLKKLTRQEAIDLFTEEAIAEFFNADDIINLEVKGHPDNIDSGWFESIGETYFFHKSVHCYISQDDHITEDEQVDHHMLQSGDEKRQLHFYVGDGGETTIYVAVTYQADRVIDEMVGR